MKYFYLCLLGIYLFTQSCYANEEQDSAPLRPKDVSHVENAVPKPLPLSHTANPPFYAVNGKTYSVLKSSAGYQETGYASWYGTKFHGKHTSSGEAYDMYEMTAASPTLPIPSFVQVTNLQNGKSVVVKVNDRGPFQKDRIMDLSYAAASKLGMLQRGTAYVQVIAIDTGIPLNQFKNYVQVAAFSNSQNAYHLMSRLKTFVHSPITVASTKQDHSLYRVLIGPIQYGEVRPLQERLLANGLDKGLIVQNA